MCFFCLYPFNRKSARLWFFLNSYYFGNLLSLRECGIPAVDNAIEIAGIPFFPVFILLPAICLRNAVRFRLSPICYKFRWLWR